MSGLMGRFLCLATVITDGLRRFVPVLLLMNKHNQKLTANTFHKNYHIQCDSHNKNRSKHRSLFNLHKEPWGLLTVTAAPMFLSKLYQENRLKTPEVWLNLGLKNTLGCTHTHISCLPSHLMYSLFLAKAFPLIPPRNQKGFGGFYCPYLICQVLKGLPRHNWLLISL